MPLAKVQVQVAVLAACLQGLLVSAVSHDPLAPSKGFVYPHPMPVSTRGYVYNPPQGVPVPVTYTGHMPGSLFQAPLPLSQSVQARAFASGPGAGARSGPEGLGYAYNYAVQHDGDASSQVEVSRGSPGSPGSLGLTRVLPILPADNTPIPVASSTPQKARALYLEDASWASTPAVPAPAAYSYRVAVDTPAIVSAHPSARSSSVVQPIPVPLSYSAAAPAPALATHLLPSSSVYPTAYQYLQTAPAVPSPYPNYYSL